MNFNITAIKAAVKSALDEAVNEGEGHFHVVANAENMVYVDIIGSVAMDYQAYDCWTDRGLQQYSEASAVTDIQIDEVQTYLPDCSDEDTPEHKLTEAIVWEAIRETKDLYNL